MRLGDRIMALLDAMNKKPFELADAIEAPRNTVYGWKEKNRNPSSEYVIPICRFFGITPNELFGYEEVQFGRVDLSDDEEELLDLFRRLDRRGRRAVLHAADLEDDRVRLEGDGAETKGTAG